MDDRSDTPAPADLRRRATFRHWTRVILRYRDQDALGHINNGVIPMSFEQARCELISPILQAHGGAHLDIVLARTIIDYLVELTYPGAIDIGTKIARFGRKSMITGHGVFRFGSEACVGTGECVLVFFDTAARASVEPPAAARSALAAFMT